MNHFLSPITFRYRRVLTLTVFAFCISMITPLGTIQANAQQTEKKYAILKLDDLVVSSEEGGPVSPRWQRVADFLETNHIPGSIGVIGNSLEEDNATYVRWIRERHDRGDIEFWLHGYWMRPSAEGHGEYEQGTAQQQRTGLEKSERLAKKKLGFSFAAFGPHWSGTTTETEKAVAEVPEIRIWLYGPAHSEYFKGISYPRYLTLENPIFTPDVEAFKKAYGQFGKGRQLLALQGHPDTWRKPGLWEGFVAIVQFLKSEGYTFTTPSEYARTIENGGN